MSKKEKFENLLRSYGVTKYWTDINLEAEEPCGTIEVNRKDSNLIMDIYKMYTKDPDGLLAEDQYLLVSYNDFSTDDEEKLEEGVYASL